MFLLKPMVMGTQQEDPVLASRPKVVSLGVELPAMLDLTGHFPSIGLTRPGSSNLHLPNAFWPSPTIHPIHIALRRWSSDYLSELPNAMQISALVVIGLLEKSPVSFLGEQH